MKHLLLTTIAAVVLVGCGESRPLSEADKALIQAARKGDIETVKQHLDAGADVNAKVMNGETSLTSAAYSGHKEIVELLLANGADVNANDRNGSTPLHSAKTKEIDELLIAKGADVNARNKNNETPIDLARRKSTRILLRENGAEYSTIHYAARHGDLDMVKKFLTKGVDVNIKYGKNEWTPLLFAAPGHHKDVLELLISKGANVNATGKRKLTALHFAARGEKLEIVQLLVNNGANIEAEDLPEHSYWVYGVPKTPLDLAYGKTKTFLSQTVSKLRAKESLHGAVSDNDIQLVKQHLAAGANVNAKNEQGQTPIHLAAKTRKVKKEITELLIEKGADVNVKAVDGATPLHRVATTEIAELLIEKGADVNVKDRKGRTPLDFAVTGKRAETEELIRKNGGERGEYKMTIYQAANIGDLETVEKLLESGTDVNQKNRQGYTPLMAAGTKEIAEFLISKGASVNESTIFGTALHEAVNSRRYEVAKVLLENGASVDAKTNVGKTPLDMAIKWKQKKIANLLRKHASKTGEELKAAKEPIHAAARQGDIEAVKQHLAAGADVNAIDHEGNTPLHHAVYNDQTEIIRLLIDKGAEVNGKRKAANHEKGVAPLHTATWRSTIETMELLIDNGADVNMKRADGAIALHYAVWFGLKEKAEFLLSKGSDVKARDGNNEGATPLHVAVWKSPNNGIVELLIENEADVNDKNNSGETPLDWAIKFDETDIADLLRKHGGKTGEELK